MKDAQRAGAQTRVPVPPRKVRIMPTMAATNPPTIIQMDRLVGAPVKVWERLEVKDWEAWMPKISRTMPATNNASPIALFICFLSIYSQHKADSYRRHGVFPAGAKAPTANAGKETTN